MDGSLVTFQEERLILVGCGDLRFNKPVHEIYELKTINGTLKWTTMPQKLKHPKSHAVAMLIPNEMTKCHILDHIPHEYDR